MCNKISYESKKEATQHYHYMRHTRKVIAKRMRPYLCIDCSKWHLTSQRKSRSRLIKRTAGLINEFRALTNNDDRWEFIIKHQGKWLEVGIYDNRTYVVFSGKVRVLFD